MGDTELYKLSFSKENSRCLIISKEYRWFIDCNEARTHFRCIHRITRAQKRTNFPDVSANKCYNLKLSSNQYLQVSIVLNQIEILGVYKLDEHSSPLEDLTALPNEGELLPLPSSRETPAILAGIEQESSEDESSVSPRKSLDEEKRAKDGKI